MNRIQFIPYPPTSFPVRDLLVLEYLSISRDDRICEVGVGSGETTVRLSKLGMTVTGFDISQPTVEALRYLEKRYPNMRLVTADVTDPTAVADYEGRFTLLVSCDTLEHVTDPPAYFRSIARLLSPGGRFLVTFPNEPKERMHGITRCESVEDLRTYMAAAGLVPEEVGAAVLTAAAKRVADRLGTAPVEHLRSVLKAFRATGVPEKADGTPEQPQTFEGTTFFRYMRLSRYLSPAVNSYWYLVLRRMQSTGRCFEIDPSFSRAPFSDCQVFLTGRLSGAPAASGLSETGLPSGTALSS